MRLIDADKLHEAIDTETYRHTYIEQIHDIIDNAPTIDAVEVVRCKECKYFTEDAWGEVNGIAYPIIVAHEICSFWGQGCKTNENGYCSYGERREP